MGLLLFLFFFTRIDIARIFNSFFFERQQCFIWTLETIWGLWETPFSPCPSPAAHMGIQRAQQRSQWHHVIGRTKSPRMRLPDSEQHRESLSIYSPQQPVNMHASNIPQNQARAFVSGLGRVLYCAMIELTKPPRHKGGRGVRAARRGLNVGTPLVLKLKFPYSEITDNTSPPFPAHVTPNNGA